GEIVRIVSQVPERQNRDRRTALRMAPASRDRPSWFRRLVITVDGPDELIADPGNGLDPLLADAQIAQGLAESPDLDGKVALLDAGVRPGGVHQLGPADDPAP